jgi:hypothetical protein
MYFDLLLIGSLVPEFLNLAGRRTNSKPNNKSSMNRFAKTVILTGLFVGTTDIILAFMTQWIKTGKFADGMFNYIAGGLIGLEQGMAGGNWAALLGIFNHYAIAMTFTVFFFIVLPRVRFLQFDKYVIGMLYGVFVNLVMRFIVLPLTPLPLGDFSLTREFVGWIALGVVLGVPIAYNAYKYYGIKDFKIGRFED